MAVTRYLNDNSWRELDQLTNRLSQMFGTGSAIPMPAAQGAWTPAVSVAETPEELVLTMELPGVDPTQVDVQMENGILIIRGTKSEARPEDETGRRDHLQERTFGRFQRAFALPQTVRVNEIAAELQDGLLCVRIPKSAEARTRRIEIRTAAGGAPTADQADHG